MTHSKGCPSKDGRRLYSDLAWTWPIISKKEEYIEEAETFCRIFQEHAQIPVKTLLHLGCGGGHLDYTLKKYLQVTSADVSEAMLGLARRLNPEVTYLLGDMRTLRLGETFDAVMVADSIDYMLSEEDLRAAFETAYIHLKPGGVFSTYAEDTLERFKQNETCYSTHSQGDVEIVFVENSYDPDPTDTTHEYTCVYLIRRGGQLSIETDQHICGLFPQEVWQRLLEEAGFEVPRVYLDMDEIPTFACVKPL